MGIEIVDLSLIDDNPFQPRSSYPRNKIEEIAYSMKEHGQIHACMCRQVNGRYQIAEGHLRKRAQLKNQKENPKKYSTLILNVQELNDEQMAVIALEENMRRQDITPIDVARQVELCCDRFKKTETEMAKKLNMTQGNISNMLRVLRCPQKVLEKVEEGKINFTMARELLVFQGLTAEGFERNWRGGGLKETPKDEEYLMMEAIRGVGGSYGPAATVDGIKKSIFQIAERSFKNLEHTSDYYGTSDRNPLFDTREAGCLKCPKMIRANETKSLVRHFCTDPKCWDKKQEAHKKKQAEEAKKKMEADIAERVVEAERHRIITEEVTGKEPTKAAPPEDTSIIPTMDGEEIDALAVDIMDVIPEDERESAREAIAHLNKDPKYPCIRCLNVGHCDRSSVYETDNRGLVCDDLLTKADAPKLREKAKAKMPEGFDKLVADKAGTRAEVLDLRELKMGSYDDMKTGYLLLSGSNFRGGTTLDIMMDPEECTERCTKGFHYGFDSSPRRSYEREKEPEVYSICSNPKCAAQKKAAFTRAKNANGMAKKKAETAAIKSAVEQTTRLDKPRMQLIIKYALDNTRHYYDDSERTIAKFIMTKLGVETVKRDNMTDRDKTVANMFKAIAEASEETLAKIIVEMILENMRYSGEMGDYKIQTTEPLNWMGIGINKPAKPLHEVFSEKQEK